MNPDEALAGVGAVLAAEAARFASFGWMRGTSGNLSAVLSHDPLRLAVTASGVDKGSLTASDIVVVDAAGQAVPNAAGQAVPDAAGQAVPGTAGRVVPRAAGEAVSGVTIEAVPEKAGEAMSGAGGQVVPGAAEREVSSYAGGAAPGAGHQSSAMPKPSAEAALHARVVELTGAGAVVHVHTVAAVVAGRRWPGGVELADLEMLKGIGVPATGEPVILPVIPNSQHMGELGDRLAAARDPRVPAVVVADHGLYAWGADPLRARHHTEIVQWLLELVVALG